jgi:predicted phage tail protein
MAGLLKRVAAERASGGRPPMLRAMGAAMVAGGAVAVITYRVLRA